MNNVKKNFLYNIVYQILVLIIPLITAPYLSRIVGVDGIGIYSYTYSIVYYFMLFTLLGVNNYGNRTIAKLRDNKKQMSKTFLEIYTVQLIMGVLMILLYLVYISLFNIKYKFISVIQVLFIFSSMIDINWFFFGLEEFKITITRNLLFKVVSLILIFIFVKQSTDLWKYTIIMSGMTVISQIVLWMFLKEKIIFSRIDFKNIQRHFKASLVMFIPVIAVSLYRIMDKIMLGFISPIVEVGFYENAEKIINIPVTIINALGVVMLPRISNLVANGKNDKVDQYINKSIKFIMFMSFPMFFGLITIGYDFAPIYFGSDFQKTGLLIMLLSLTIPFLSFANVIRTQYLIPKEKDKIYIWSVALGALSNLIFNIVLIPKYNSIGACTGTIIAEFVVMSYQVVMIRKEISIKKYLKNIFPFFLKSLIMFMIIYPLNFVDINAILRLLIQIIFGSVIYTVLNYKYIFTIINIRKIINKLLIKRRKSIYE